jgi:hypothetical protein
MQIQSQRQAPRANKTKGWVCIMGTNHWSARALPANSLKKKHRQSEVIYKTIPPIARQTQPSARSRAEAVLTRLRLEPGHHDLGEGFVSKGVHFVVVQHAFPTSNHRRGNTVAQQID